MLCSFFVCVLFVFVSVFCYFSKPSFYWLDAQSDLRQVTSFNTITKRNRKTMFLRTESAFIQIWVSTYCAHFLLSLVFCSILRELFVFDKTTMPTTILVWNVWLGNRIKEFFSTFCVISAFLSKQKLNQETQEHIIVWHC